MIQYLQAAAPQGSPWVSLIIPIGFIAFFYFFIIRPQKKRDAEISAMRDRLKVGDVVLTIGGVKGKIVKLNEEDLVIETGMDKTQLTFMRWGVGTKLND